MAEARVVLLVATLASGAAGAGDGDGGGGGEGWWWCRGGGGVAHRERKASDFRLRRFMCWRCVAAAGSTESRGGCEWTYAGFVIDAVGQEECVLIP